LPEKWWTIGEGEEARVYISNTPSDVQLQLLDKAPEEVVDKERERLETLRERTGRTGELLAVLGQGGAIWGLPMTNRLCVTEIPWVGFQ